MAMNRLKEMRLKHHLHQYDFEKLGFSATTYRKSEQGSRQVSWDEWRKLADFYQVSIPYLQENDRYIVKCNHCNLTFKIYSKEEFDNYRFCPKCRRKNLIKEIEEE